MLPRSGEIGTDYAGPFSQEVVVVVTKAVILGALMLLVGFLLWRLIAAELVNPAKELAVAVDKEDFAWFACSSCGKTFMGQATTRKGYCPYCKFQMMLATEDKRVLGEGTNDQDYAWFFSRECGNLFFARDTGRMGVCPYCAEPLDLTAPKTTVAMDSSRPARVVAWTRANFRGLLAGALAIFVVSVGAIYFLIETRTILSLRPVEGAVSQGAGIEFSRWQSRKKTITIGNAQNNDVVLTEPSLGGVRYVVSFVRVGGKTRAYLSRSQNRPITINEESQYNPRLQDHDKVRLGNAVFEVSTRDT